VGFTIFGVDLFAVSGKPRDKPRNFGARQRGYLKKNCGTCLECKNIVCKHREIADIEF